MKIIIAVLLIFILVAAAACNSSQAGTVTSTVSSSTKSTTGSTANTATSTNGSTTEVVYDENDINSEVTTSEVTYVNLNGTSISVSGQGAAVDGSILTITAAGTYDISGTLSDGQIRVYTNSGEETVRLVFSGVNITCSNSAAVYVINAGKTIITLTEGTENYLTDGDTYVIENTAENEPNAAIFSNDDLTINGSGSLTVNANYNNGIQSKDDLKITGGRITVNAVNDALKGKDSVAIKDGVIALTAGNDGIQASNDQDTAQGYAVIEGGTLSVTAGADGIQAETNVTVSGGNITIKSGGGSANSSDKSGWGNWGPGGNQTSETSSTSAKGIKAAVAIIIQGGTIKIDSSDDSLNANGSLTICGGNVTMSSGDDGMHANNTLAISGGEVNITNSYEGIESTEITISAGNIHIVASDDGINGAGGVDGSAINSRPGQNNFNEAGDCSLNIAGGYLYVNANGDGLDVNGPITMTAGTVIVDGPTNDGNGALDYTGSFKITGGILVAAGSSGMAMAPGTASTQYSVMYNYSSAKAAGTLFHLETADGTEILTFAPAKSYESVVICSPLLENGTEYIIYSGGSSGGTVTDGVYSGGTYTPGTEVTSFMLSSTVTSLGTSSGTGGGMAPPGGGRR